MESKLNIDPKMVDSARTHAAHIARDMQEFIDVHTTVSTERTILRLLGVDGVDDVETPLPNVVVEQIQAAGGLPRGAAYWMGNAMIQTGLQPQEIAEKISKGEMDITKLETASAKEAEEAIMPAVHEALKKIRVQSKKREDYLSTLGEGTKPYLYVIVATGNIYEDVVQAKAAARQGADVIAVIRTTAQSLLDYVPYGPTTEGFGGTYATQENFRIMGMMVFVGPSGNSLAGVISTFFVGISTKVTFPLFTFLSAGIVNIFIPSGGGQWVVQGPIMWKPLLAALKRR